MTLPDNKWNRPYHPRSAPSPVKRYACAVCQARTDVLICRECAEDDRSLARVQAWLDGVSDQQATAVEDWDRLREAHAAKWQQLLDARRSEDYAARCAKARAAGNIYGQLLDGFERYEQTMARLGEERMRLEKALELLGTLT